MRASKQGHTSSDTSQSAADALLFSYESGGAREAIEQFHPFLEPELFFRGHSSANNKLCKFSLPNSRMVQMGDGSMVEWVMYPHTMIHDPSRLEEYYVKFITALLK